MKICIGNALSFYDLLILEINMFSKVLRLASINLIFLGASIRELAVAAGTGTAAVPAPPAPRVWDSTTRNLEVG